MIVFAGYDGQTWRQDLWALNLGTIYAIPTLLIEQDLNHLPMIQFLGNGAS